MSGLRAPGVVMRLARMGGFHQTRLSFMRALLRDLQRERWRFARTRFEVDARGSGLALYRAQGPQRAYTLVCFAHDLPAAQRSDRVIAERWDATFALFDGAPGKRDLQRLAQNVPLQEAGQLSAREIVMSRANRSVRLFEHVVAQLANGKQPARARLDESGYLMRTTAVYANGKFGLCERDALQSRAELTPPFRAEMLAVWLIRWFSIDIAEHLARMRGGARAVKLAPAHARRLGIGNATGLGMAPFLLQHPALLHRWMHARESALARVRALAASDEVTRARFCDALTRAAREVAEWRSADEVQREKLRALQNDLQKVQAQVDLGALRKKMAWEKLAQWAHAELSMEGQEMMVTLLIEPHGELVDELCAHMAVEESRYARLRGEQSVGELRAHIDAHYDWALAENYANKNACARFWYVSEEKLEPRLGERFAEPGAEKELPLAAARDVAALRADLQNFAAEKTLAEFLAAHPQHRHAAQRAQLVARLPYAEIRDNLIAQDMRPVDLLRCKLSFFGATRFDPKSDRWVRITMFRHAPFPFELAGAHADDWAFAPAE